MATIGSLSTFLTTLNSSAFLFSNRYQVTLSGISSTNLTTFCCKVDLPSVDYTQVDLDLGGRVVGVPSKMALGDLQLTFYNTGTELKAIHSFCDSKLYVSSTHSVGYYDDVKMDITVVEYDRANTTVLTRKFTSCILKSITPLTLSYAEATEIQQFTIVFSCGAYTVS